MPPGSPERATPSVDSLRAVGLAAGLDAVEIATAEVFEAARAALISRKDAGLHGGMAFTYLNPDRSTDPGRALPDAATLLVGARGYLTEAQGGASARGGGPAGRVARYVWDDHYTALRAGLAAMAHELRAHGWRARVLADDNAMVDRAAAHRAGLGWWGKNANLLLPGLGSWCVIGSVVTDAPIEPTAAEVPDGCGSCTRCLTECPTGAIVEPGVVDARRCLAWLLQAEGSFPVEHRVALGDRIYGCDECQDVCPANRRAPVREATGVERSWVPLLQLLDEDDATVLWWAGAWYIPRREVRYVRRNALVVLGNVADGEAAEVASVLGRYLAHADPLLRSHAVWAARRLGREDLLRPIAGDPDPQVAAELAAAVPAR